MSDRAVLFLVSVVVVLLSLAAAAWLVVSGQALYLDGLFLLATCLVLAFAFSVYAAGIVRRAREEIAAERVPAKSAAPAAKSAAAPAEQRQPSAIA